MVGKPRWPSALCLISYDLCADAAVAVFSRCVGMRGRPPTYTGLDADISLHFLTATLDKALCTLVSLPVKRNDASRGFGKVLSTRESL